MGAACGPPAQLDLLGQLDEPQLLRKELDSFVRRLRLFTPGRWSAAAPVLGTRADVVRHLAQRCADASASLEGHPRRELPMLHPDLLLADQLAVTGDDLLRAAVRGPVAVGDAGRSSPVPGDDTRVVGSRQGSPGGSDAVGMAVAHLLLHRWHVLGDEPPVALGGQTVLDLGRSVCGTP